MRKILFLVLFASWALVANAQLANKPYWIACRPVSTNPTYYFRVTIGEGPDYEKAYANAFAKAIQESSWKLGVKVTNTEDLNSIIDGSFENISFEESTMNIALNKVCEYTEQLQTKTGLRVFVLWQVASSGNITPLFDDFNECE